MAPTPSSMPSVSPRYLLRELLGRGGMGEVYLAYDRQDEELVALKRVLTASGADRWHLQREARTLSRLRHEHIVRLLDVTSTGEETFFTMEYVQGVPLSVYLERPMPGPDEIRWLLGVGTQILDVLTYLHGQGLLHRDLKPSNVMVLAEPEDAPLPPGERAERVLTYERPQIKVLDFGFSLQRELARTHVLSTGTPLYMAPEQLRGSAADDRQDLYSVGALLYHLVTRTPPYARRTDALSSKKQPATPSDRNPALPPGLDDFLLKLLQTEPHRRFGSAQEARETLFSLLDAKHQAQVAALRLRPPVFVGRDPELEQLRKHLSEASGGAGCCLQITGEHNAGKTWLLSESGILSEAVADFGMTYVRGTCSAAASPRQGLPGALEELLARLEEDASRSADILAERRLLNGFLGGLEETSTSPSPTPPPTQEQIVEAATQALQTAATLQPLLVVLDDVHEADDFTIAVLSRLCTLASGIPFVLIVSYRVEAVAEGSPLERWSQQVAAAGHPPPLELNDLTDSELLKLARRMLSPEGELSTGLTRWLLKRSEGQAFRTARWLQILWDRGALIRAGQEWDLDESMGTEQEALDTWSPQLQALTPLERDVLAAVVALGPGVDVDTLAAAYDDAAPAPTKATETEATPAHSKLPALLRSLVERGFLAGGFDGYHLSANVRPDAASELVGAEKLRSWHQRAAQKLLREQKQLKRGASNNLFRLAGHLRCSGQSEEAAATYLEAARYARGMYANQRAIDCYRDCLELSSDLAVRLAAAEEAGCLQSRTGDYPGALQHLELALSVNGDDDETTGRILDHIGRVFWRQGRLDEALQKFSDALAIGETFPEIHARLLLHLGGVHWQQGDLDAARSHFNRSHELYTELEDFARLVEVHSNLGLVEKREERLELATRHFEAALACAEKSSDVAGVAAALGNLGNLHRARGDDSRALEFLQRSRAVRERCGDRQGLGICLNNLARIHSFRGEYEAGRVSTEKALKIFEEVGDPKGVWIARYNLASFLQALGKFEEARTLLVHNREHATRCGLKSAGTNCLWNLGALEAELGEYDAAAEFVTRGLREPPGEKPSELRANLLAVLATARIAQENFESAEDCLREAAEIAKDLELSESLSQIVCVRVRLHLERGDPEEALRVGRPCLEDANSRTDRYNAAHLHREVGRVYRELGPDWADRTEKHLRNALREFQRMGSPHQVAETQQELAVYWRLLGEDGEAQTLFDEAERGYEEAGATRRLQELKRLRKR